MGTEGFPAGPPLEEGLLGVCAQAALSGKGTSLDEAGALPKGPSPTCIGHGSRGLDDCGGGRQCGRPGGAGRSPPFQLGHSGGGFWARWLGLRGCHAPSLRHRGPCAPRGDWLSSGKVVYQTGRRKAAKAMVLATCGASASSGFPPPFPYPGTPGVGVLPQFLQYQ